MKEVSRLDLVLETNPACDFIKTKRLTFDFCMIKNKSNFINRILSLE